MNRYRSVPGLGPARATPQTTCQKCLKKGHYSYECKASLQERPYAPRLSRTQLFKNPKLVAPLESERDGGSMAMMDSAGVADQVLKERDALRKDPTRMRSQSPDGSKMDAGRGRARSRSTSAESVATISTDNDRPRSPPRRRQEPRSSLDQNGLSPSRSPRKRRYSSLSRASASESAPYSPTVAPGSHRKSRRHRTISPDDRGRPHSVRRGSRRSRSGSAEQSMDQSRITKQRKVLERDDEDESEEEDDAVLREDRYQPRRAENGQRSNRSGNKTDRRRSDGFSRPSGERDDYGSGKKTGFAGGGQSGQRRKKDRSLSPYSRRLALTQAMNVGR